METFNEVQNRLSAILEKLREARKSREFAYDRLQQFAKKAGSVKKYADDEMRQILRLTVCCSSLLREFKDPRSMSETALVFAARSRRLVYRFLSIVAQELIDALAIAEKSAATEESRVEEQPDIQKVKEYIRRSIVGEDGLKEDKQLSELVEELLGRLK